MRLPSGRRDGLRIRLHGLPRNARELGSATLLLAQLRQLGWFRSAAVRKAESSDGKPLPWLTYPALLLLETALKPSDLVLEYGGGQSTRWLSPRVAQVTTLENKPEWLGDVAGLPNVSVLATQPSLVPEPDTPTLLPGYDILIVDGGDRPACLLDAVNRVLPGGLLLLDDAGRPEYERILSEMAGAGWGRIDLTGPCPGVGYIKTTSVFLRDLARLGGSTPPPQWQHSRDA